MSGLLYQHSFWTRPCFRSEAAWRSEDIVVWDFEMVTWLVSALQARRHGRVRLVTDSRGFQFARRTGIDWVYNGGISTELDEIPGDMNSDVFWAAAKLYSLRSVAEPVVSLDADAIFWQPLVPSAPVMALHAEDPCWAWNTYNRERYEAMGFADGTWNWELSPFTTGVVYLEAPRLAQEYAETAIEFMERFSRHVEDCSLPPETWSDAMLFAEQRLLPMCAARRGQSVAALGRVRPGFFQLEKNPRFCHLWTSKQNYRQSDEAREAFVRHLVDFIRREWPEAVPTVERWGVPGRRAEASGIDGRARSGLEHQPCYRLGRVTGEVVIVDANCDARRLAYPGSVVLPGESVEGPPGSSFELKADGTEGLIFVSPENQPTRKER